MTAARILLIGGKGGSVSEGIYKCLMMAGYKNITLLEYTKNAALIYRIKKHIITDKNPDDGYPYIKKLINICHSNKLNIIIPGATWEARIISKFQGDFRQEQITCLVNNPKVIDICSDKRKTYEFLSAHNIGAPKTFTNIKESLKSLNKKTSMIIKPVFGRGSQNIYKASHPAELKAVLHYFNVMRIPCIIQEYIADDEQEYTVGVLSDKNGLSSRSIVMQRFLWGGATGYAKVIKRGAINAFCEDLAAQIGSTGPLNIQLRLDKNKKPLIFEINPRFSGSAPMRALAGFNEPDIMLKNFHFNQALRKTGIKVGRQYYRAFQEIQIKPNSRTGEALNFL